MSDTQGATDLDADMPGIGAAPGIARGAPQGLPSQLQALVQHFTQTSQGKPNPTFLPPPPGQGQQQGKPPKLGPVDPPDRSAYSIAPVPANAPHPPRAFNPYMRPIPRDSAQWGQPEQFQRLPQSFELPGMFQQLGGYFGQHGGFASAPMGIGMAAYSKAYQDAFQKGQEQKMRMAKEQMQLHAAQLEDLEQTRSIEYADVFARHHEMGDDPTAVHDDLWKVAVQHGDKDVIAMIEGGASAEQVRRFLADHEAHIRALGAANKKTEETDIDDAAWGLTPRATEQGGVYDPYGAGATQPGTAAAPAGAAAAPGATADQRAPGVGDPLDKDKPADPDATPRETPIEEEGDNVARGFEPTTGLDPNKKRAAILNGMQKNARLDQIIGEANSGKIKPEDVLGKVREVSPSMAQELDNTMNYRTGSGQSGQAQGGKEQEYRARLASLARLAKPGDEQGVGGWNQSTYKAVSDFREESQKPNSPIQRIPTAVEAAQNVRRDLAAIQSRDGSTADVSPETLSGAAGKDPLYAQLKIDWIRYNEDIDVLTRGSPSVGMAEQAINTQPQIPYFGSISGYRAAVRRDMDQAQSRVKQLHNTWSSYRTGDAMPGYNPDAERSMNGIAKMDFITGATPGEVVSHPDGTKWRYLGANPENPGDIDANWRVVE